MMTLRLKATARAVAGLLAVAFAAPALASSGQSALPEASGPTIEYESVAAARQALGRKAGVVFTTENGWDIATDEAALTIWSFSPSDYPAHPAVVKRQVVEDGRFQRQCGEGDDRERTTRLPHSGLLKAGRDGRESH